jgi:hypothetical protein
MCPANPLRRGGTQHKASGVPVGDIVQDRCVHRLKLMEKAGTQNAILLLKWAVKSGWVSL